MKPTWKMLAFLAVLIFSAVMATEDVNADNYVSLNAHQMDADDYLILEFDFTQGESAYVDIDIQTTYSDVLQKMNVDLMPQASLGALMTGGTKWYYNGYDSECVADYDKTFIMDSDDWWYGTYYFVVETYYANIVWLDVEFYVYIDYDGDGKYSDTDEYPLFNDDWLEGLEDRLTGIESNLTLSYQWTMENITALSSELSDKYQWTMENITVLSTALDEFKDNTSDEFSSLRYELDQEISSLRVELEQKVSSLLAGLEALRVEMLAQDSDIRNELKDNVTGLQENITALQSLLSTLEIQVYEVCDSMNETTISMGLELGAEITALSEALNTTDEWLQEVEVQLETDLASTNDRIGEVEDDMLGRLTVAKTEFNLALIELDDKEKENNDARMLEIQDAQTDIENAQEDIEDALEEAKAARTVGLVTGLVGIILAIVAIVEVARIKSRDGDVKEE